MSLVRMDFDTIDHCKENIQPLRQGRKLSQLKLALEAETNSDVHIKLIQERDRYELLIRMYEGPDPLEPRYNYVSWLEQSYPKHGRDINLIPLLEDTITNFKDDKRYMQDARFIELVVKYVGMQTNPLELYQVVFNQGIGTMCAILYKSWAEVLDGSGNLKKADQVFQMGISNRAQPLDWLKQEHTQFQLSVGRRMLTNLGDVVNVNESEETQALPRQAFGKLPNTKVPSIRPPTSAPGTIPLCLSQRQNIKQNPSIAVFKDENEEISLGCRTPQITKLPAASHSTKENSLKPGTWNKKYKSHSTTSLMTPNFKVHVDPETLLGSNEQPMSQALSALKTRKPETTQRTPMAVFEQSEPNTQDMYCKHLVYAGGRELQLEEIRAAIYEKKKLGNRSILSSTLSAVKQIQGGNHGEQKNTIKKKCLKFETFDEEPEEYTCKNSLLHLSSSKEKPYVEGDGDSDAIINIHVGDDNESPLPFCDNNLRSKEQLTSNIKRPGIKVYDEVSDWTPVTVNKQSKILSEKEYEKSVNRNKSESSGINFTSGTSKTAFTVFQDDLVPETPISRKKFTINDSHGEIPSKRVSKPNESNSSLEKNNDQVKVKVKNDAAVYQEFSYKPSFSVFQDEKDDSSKKGSLKRSFDDFSLVNNQTNSNDLQFKLCEDDTKDEKSVSTSGDVCSFKIFCDH